MSLTSHLKDRASPVRAFLLAAAPQLALAGTRGYEGKDAAAALRFPRAMARPVRSAIPEVASRKGHAIATGIAFDYRVRMELQGPMFEVGDTTAAIGVDKLRYYTAIVSGSAHRYQIFDELFETARDLVAHGGAEDLDRAAIALGWCESLARSMHQSLAGSLGAMVDAARSGAELVSQIPTERLSDLVALREANAQQLYRWREQIQDGVPFVANPWFDGSLEVGGADADWLIGGQLIDSKTSEKITAPWLREALLQLLGYVLLDFSDEYRIREVAVWTPRHSGLDVWGVDELIRADAKTALPKLRRDFRRML